MCGTSARIHFESMPDFAKADRIESLVSDPNQRITFDQNARFALVGSIFDVQTILQSRPSVDLFLGGMRQFS